MRYDKQSQALVNKNIVQKVINKKVERMAKRNKIASSLQKPFKDPTKRIDFKTKILLTL